MRQFYFLSHAKKKKKLKREKYEDNRWLHENVSKTAAQFNGRNGIETLLCDVIVVLNNAAFLRESFVGNVLDLTTTLIILGKWLRSSPVVRRALFAWFSSFVCCPIAGLQHSKLQIVSIASSLTKQNKSK